MPLSSGSRLGPYEILAPLGAGGMGEVYRARDSKLGRDVAIKVLPEEMALDAERLTRFEREARALAALNHPGVVTIYSIEQAGQTRYLAMELVEGESLNKAMSSGGFPLARFFDIAVPLAEALSAAHERGIIHRDLKPANVMVTREGRVKVLDFGLAKLEASAFSGRDTDEIPTASLVELTGEGQIFGTVAYMSPEQARGGKLDARSDIFSLGIMLYQMLTGERPFRGDSAVDLLTSILRDRPASVTDLRPDLPPHLSWIVRRCLEKDPRDRYQTSRDVYNELKDLRAEISLPPAKAAPVTDVAIAVLPFEDLSPARDQDYMCEGMAEEIMNALTRTRGIRVASRTSAFRAAREGKDLAEIARVLSVSHVLEGSVRAAGSRLRVTTRLTGVETGYQLWSERYDREAADVFALQDDIAAGVVEAVRTRLSLGDQPVLARPQVANLEAYRHYLMGRHLRFSRNDFAAAAKAFREAVRLDPTHAPSWIGLAEVQILATFYGLVAADDAYASAREAIARADLQRVESAEALYVEGLLAFGDRDWRSSERVLRRAVALAPNYPPALCWSAFVRTILGRAGEAVEDLRRAREADPLAPYAYAMSAIALLLVGRAAEADAFLDQALVFEPENTLALWGAGLARIALARGEEGIALLERALTPSHRGGFIHGALGWALAVEGRMDEARRVLSELQAKPSGSPAVVSEAWLLWALGEKDAAFRLLERAEVERQPALALAGLPGFDSLRSDPRFGALLSRMGLPVPRS